MDSTDNSSKPSSEPASHVARQRLESTEKKKISGKVTKSLSASALSLMIPGGRETCTRMRRCGLCMWPVPLPQFGRLVEVQDCLKQQGGVPAQLSRAFTCRNPSSQAACVPHFLLLLSASGDEAAFLSSKPYFFCFLSFSFLPLQTEVIYFPPG